MKVAIILPFRHSNSEIWGGLLGPGYLLSILQESNIDTTTITVDDNSRLSDDDISDLNRFAPDVTLISVHYLNHIQHADATCKQLRQSGYDGLVGIGGHTATVLKQEILDHVSADFVLYGECEQSILDLITCLKSNKNWQQMDGICYRDADAIIVNPPPPPPCALDELPYPQRIGLERYSGSLQVFELTASISGSRGCRYNCSFCSVRAFERAANVSRRARSAQSLVEEMVSVHDTFGTTSFVLWDDSFGASTSGEQQRLTELARAIHQSGLDCSFFMEMRANEILNATPQALELLVRSGLKRVLVGIESGDDRILKFLNKGTTVAVNSEACRVLASHNIDVSAGLIPFTPVSDKESILNTISFVKQHRIYSSRATIDGLFNKLGVYPKTPLHRKLLDLDLMTKQHILSHDDVFDYQFQHPSIAKLATASSRVKDSVQKALNYVTRHSFTITEEKRKARQLGAIAVEAIEEMVHKASTLDADQLAEIGLSYFHHYEVTG